MTRSALKYEHQVYGSDPPRAEILPVLKRLNPFFIRSTVLTLKIVFIC